MSKVLDKNYYPVPFEGGSSLVDTASSGTGTIETHEFYNKDGKVVFYWKLKKDSEGNLTDFRLKVPNSPATASVTYKNYDNIT
jgi:activator of HSP90 ATPase